MFNKYLNKIFVGIFILALHVTPYTLHVCYASYEDIGCGARPLGIGNAFCAIADDANAFLYNPAGFPQLKKLQVSAMYANLYPLLSDRSIISNNYLAVAYPMKQAAIGVAWFSLGAVSDPERSKAQYQENTYLLTYARQMERFYIGFSARFHSKEYGVNDWTAVNPVFTRKKTAFGVGIDAAMLYRTEDNLFKFGLLVADINQPDLGIASPSPVPMSARAGIAYEFEPVWVFNDLTGAVDVTYRDNDVKAQGGIEGWFIERTVAVRIGGGFGSNSYGLISMGASYQLTEEQYNNDFRIDYAFSCPLGGLQPTGGTHRISLTMGFDVK